MKQIQADYFSVRLRIAGGNVTLPQMETIYRVAEKFGQGYVHLTTRQGMEIPFIHFKDIEAVRTELLAGGVQMSVCGGTVRTVMGCQGSAICLHGLIDGKEMAADIDRLFFAQTVPAKFKISVTGCFRSCAKPQENDLGFEGAIKPQLQVDDCIHCGICAESCPTKAIVMQDGVPVFHQADCMFCGNCTNACPTEAWQVAEQGVKVWAGGRIGRDPKLGQVILEFVALDKIPAIIEANLNFFRAHGKNKERFGKTVERVGLAALQEVLLDATKQIP